MATSSENTTNQQRLGQLLRSHRISQEWSLEDVSSQTRLDVLVLRHLEEGNLEAPPGKVFMRGFLRIYLQFLQIPPSELELFKEVVEQRPIIEEKITPVHLDPFESKPISINLHKWISGLGLAAVILLIWQLNIWDLSENSENSIETTVSEKDDSISINMNEQNDAPQTQATVGMVKDRINELKVVDNISDDLGKRSGDEVNQKERIDPTIKKNVETEEIKPTFPVESSVHKLALTETSYIFPILELRAEESVWIAVQADNEQPSLHYLKAGEIQSWETAKKFYILSIGDPKILQIRLDEKQYPLPDNEGLVLDWKIKLNKTE